MTLRRMLGCVLCYVLLRNKRIDLPTEVGKGKGLAGWLAGWRQFAHWTFCNFTLLPTVYELSLRTYMFTITITLT